MRTPALNTLNTQREDSLFTLQLIQTSREVSLLCMTLDLVGLKTYPSAGGGRRQEEAEEEAGAVCTVLIMGRWKRNKEAKKSKQSNNRRAAASAAAFADGGNGAVVGGVEDDDEKVRDWTWQDRNYVLRYLDDYRIGCEQQLHQQAPQPSDQQQQQQQQEQPQQQEQHHDVLIGGYSFPALSNTILQAPYLELPRHLTRKHRRMIHELCVEAMLFHMTLVDDTLLLQNDTAAPCSLPVSLVEQDDYGDNDHDNDDDAHAQQLQHESATSSSSSYTTASRSGRYIVISIYADGFDGIPAAYSQQQQQQRQDSNNDAQLVHQGLNILKYKPWYCRKERHHHHHHDDDDENNQDSTTSTMSTEAAMVAAKAHSGIDHLIDQPGECLRDGRDEVDFEKWDGQDLSTMPPPTTCIDDVDADMNTPSSSSSSSSSWLLVDSVDKMQQCIAELEQALPNITELGFDLEAWNPSKYAQVTCLLQITTNLGRDYVIDTLAPGVWDLVGPGLAPLFANASIVKVGHSIGGLDIRCLHRDFGILVVNVFDTYEASKVLQLSSHGLASVCAHYGLALHENEEYTQLKATYQTCDWRRRPLTAPMILYGRYDVHYLLRLRHLMMRDLTRHDLWDTTPVQHDATSRLVALALRKTLAQFALEDDDDDAADYYYQHDNYKNDNDQQDDDDDANPDNPNPNEANDMIAADDDDDDDDGPPPPPDTAAVGTITWEEEIGQGGDDDSAKQQQDYDRSNDDEDEGNEAFYTPKGSVRSLCAGQLGLGEEDSDDDNRKNGGSLRFRNTTRSTRNVHDYDDFEASGRGRSNESQVNYSDENIDDIGEEENGLDREPIASVPVLRLQPKLMAVLSQSQERCRDLWSGRSEPASNTGTLLNIQRRAKQQRIIRQHNMKRKLKNNGPTSVEQKKENSIRLLLVPDWTEQNDKLYHALVAWRDQVAREWEVLPGLVIPLDMLVPVAWQRPQTRAELQRIRFDLPGIFFYNNGQYMNELLNLVKREFPLEQSYPDSKNDIDAGNTNMIYLYANRASESAGAASNPPPPPPPKEESDTNDPTIYVAVTPDDNAVATGHENVIDIIDKDETAAPRIAAHVDQEIPAPLPVVATATARSSSAVFPAKDSAVTTPPTAQSPPTANDNADDDDDDGVSDESVYRWHRVAWMVAGVAVIVLIAVRSRHGGRR